MRKLREKRASRGLTLIALGHILDADPGGLSRIERGQQLPSIALAKKLAAFYGMTLDDIFYEDQQKEAA